MGWFEEQIKERKRFDEENVIDAVEELSATILGRTYISKDEQKRITGAVDEIFAFYNIKVRNIPENITELEARLEYVCRPHGIMRRTVTLRRGWYKNAVGAFLGKRKDGRIVALIPNGFRGYSYFDEDSGKRVQINSSTENNLESEAQCFYKPLPAKKLTPFALLKFVNESVPRSGTVLLCVVTFLAVLIGMLSPRITNLLFSDIYESGNIKLLIFIALFSLSVGVSALLIGIVKTLLNRRITAQRSVVLQAAAMARLLSLPVSFFKKYSAGELASKLNHLNTLCSDLLSSLVVGGLTAIMSLVYFIQVFKYTPALTVPAIIITLLSVGVCLIPARLRAKEFRAAIEVGNKSNGMLYSVIRGVQKVKLSGAENRAFARWVRLYNEEMKHTFSTPSILLLTNTIVMAISSLGTILFYYLAAESKVSVADFYSFTVAYGMVSAAFLSISELIGKITMIKPILEQVAPILEAVPEVSEDKSTLFTVTGAIELNNVFFRYTDKTPYIIKNLSLEILPGQYVGIVGKTGCGKSTLLRLLLGFESPNRGAVYYDGKDVSKLDLKALRQSIGVVMQNGKLFHGDIFSNITIAAPQLTLEDAWKAAEIAGVAEDIRRMPMGMHTIISEDGGGISGGQRQRLMIARAIAPNPKILMFDEATSALDNTTQKNISEALRGLDCTRLVIAHRLSTIRDCDRIIILDDGKIVGDGTYDDLLATNEFFKELISRQRLDA